MVTHLAVDFGGGSGRVIAGSVSGDKLEMVEIHRFPESPDTFGKPFVLGFSLSVRGDENRNQKGCPAWI